MTTLRRLSRLAETFGSARRYAHLFSLSDRDLAARGYSRDGLTRSYIAGLGAQ